MPRVIITEGAAQGLERCRLVLAGKNPEAAMRAGQAIERQFALLEMEPEVVRQWWNRWQWQVQRVLLLPRLLLLSRLGGLRS